jgi:phosphoribosylformimino-5-aminoimidazole carboxamide ribotide isomerase
MIVTPAVDLRNGRCVQLVGGSYDQQIVELDDPVGVAARWESDGFGTLHVVDLDAATSRGSNAELVERILDAASADVQVGGGLRSTESVDRMISAGAARVVLGTRAFEDRAWLENIVAAYPQQVVVAADTQGSAIVTHGWVKRSAKSLAVEISALNDLPLAGLLVTAVHKEGLMKGPDLDLMREIVAISDHPVQASGGIATIDDIRSLAELGVSSAIVGMALYTGALSAAQIQKEFNQ